MSDLQNQILIVEDEFLVATVLRLQMEALGFKVCGIVATADDAIALAQEYRPAVVLMDIRLRGKKDGIDAALAIHATVGSKVVFVTGSNDPVSLARIQLDHPSAVLIKPVAEWRLKGAIKAAWPM